MESVHQMRKIKHPGQAISPAFRVGIISTVAVFFRYAALFERDDVPARPLITHTDMPRRIQRVPGSSPTTSSTRSWTASARWNVRCSGARC
jgi:hypothetical protein